MACRLAGSPTLRSLLSTKATIEGVVRRPSLLGITGSLPSMTATQELRGTEVNSNNLSHNRYLFISVITEFIVLILFCYRILQSLCQAVRQGDFASMLSARALPLGQVGILR